MINARQIQRRQTILNILNKFGTMTLEELIEATGFNKRTLQTYLREMRSDREIRSKETPCGRVSGWRHTALMHTTKLVAVAPPKKPVVGQKVGPNGGRLHLGTERDHPLPDARGQGALRRSVSVGSSAEFI